MPCAGSGSRLVTTQTHLPAIVRVVATASAEQYSLRMSPQLPISRVINLIPDASQRLWSVDASEARRRLLAGDAADVLRIDGSFALVAQDGERVVLARSLDRPLR